MTLARPVIPGCGWVRSQNKLGLKFAGYLSRDTPSNPILLPNTQSPCTSMEDILSFALGSHYWCTAISAVMPRPMS